MTDWLTIEEAAEHLKMGRSTMYKLAQAGRIPGHKVGSAWRFDAAELDDWLKSGKAAVTTVSRPKRKKSEQKKIDGLYLKEVEILLRQRHDELARDYGVTEIGVFGSFVRGEASKDSDIDILVTFNRPMGFFKFLELEERLSKWLGRKVDLVTKAALKPHIGRRVLSEVAMV